jgi:hypothetical protein
VDLSESELEVKESYHRGFLKKHNMRIYGPNLVLSEHSFVDVPLKHYPQESTTTIDILAIVGGVVPKRRVLDSNPKLIMNDKSLNDKFKLHNHFTGTLIMYQSRCVSIYLKAPDL